ncbi:nicotinate-nucleotide adenylyltransferase [Legionella saoudiensis]|uniref:nicotinate-nucleotide adenylyltransferase n=1 Tax=Legionella saoudiensis TaxID=1750561 RepID=UPI0007306A8A|nr:nicotinate-nucleotide adenylyltransferase [Legionella saoudiensis]
MQHIAIFGGTFDPIHNGHLQTSLTIQSFFKFDTYFFLPCKVPTLKPTAVASNKQRINMIRLAIKAYPYFKLDLREIERNTPSYMVETLQSFRDEFPNASITLIIGYDSFISLPKWHQWEKLITLANILVINRNEFVHHQIPKLMHQFLVKYQCNKKTDLLKHKAGTVVMFDAGNYEISSTRIREKIKMGKDVECKIPKEVNDYIKDEGLYH